MESSKTVVCISTTKPSSAITPSGGGGSLTVLCPQTGSILSSIRTSADLSGKTTLGISSLSAFPESFSPPGEQLVLSFGGNSSRKGDNYAMLLGIRPAPSAPILHWKCRLPEADLVGGMSASPCGHYIVGGGASGSCFVWSSLGGKLLKTFKAHYRACTCLAWSECGRYLVTGGADGMVHLFPLIDLVDIATRRSRRSVAPLHTWSVHHFPVTCLSLLDGDRIASAAQDGHVAILELFSRITLAKIKLPHPVESLAHHDSRLYAGSDHGTIYSIDLNAYAMYQTEKQGATLSKRMQKDRQASFVPEEKVFGKDTTDENESLTTFQTEWVGHGHGVLSLAISVKDTKQHMISGDRLGEVRIWDIESRTCLNTIRPWSNIAPNATGNVSQENVGSESLQHPIASIAVLRQPSETLKSGMFGAPAGSSTKSQSSITNMFPPLQKYPQDNTGAEDDDASLTPVAFSMPTQTEESLRYWAARQLVRRRKRNHEEVSKENTSTTDELQDSKHLIERLQQELEQKRVEILRWKEVNNKLMAKLKSKS
eukprot:scaffold1062_cov130-Cylindrotheca_fusiformis.AAC.37